MKWFFNKKRRPKRYLMPKKRTGTTKRRSVASEFTRKRRSGVKFKFSRFKFRTFKLLGLMAGFSLIIGVGVLLLSGAFFKGYFALSQIKLKRMDFRVDIEEIAPTVQGFRGQNLVFVSKKQIAQELMERHPYIKDVEIEKSYPRAILLNISTYPIKLRWKMKIQEEDLVKNTKEIKERVYFINKVGKISSGSSEDEDAFLIEEQNIHKQEPEKNMLIIEEGALNEILGSKGLLEEIMQISVVRAEYFRYAREIHYLTENNISIWMDFATPHEEQIKKLYNVLAEVEILKESLAYIDLRVKGRVYYKKK